MAQLPPALWYHNTVIYQIYPRSFADSNHDGIGDLQGIIGKLDYLQSLGVETLWISPFYQSPQQDFGYDISNYCAISPEYGTMTDAEQLINEVHKRGMYVVFDMVMNHTSDQHQWFLESKQSPNNLKSDWYIWQNGKAKRPPNNWRSMLAEGGWHYVPDRKQWYFASFLPFQPDLNYRNEEVKQAMFEVVRFWLQKGVDGFRLDIFNAIMKDPHFRDNPFTLQLLPSPEAPGGLFQQPLYTVNHPDNFRLAQQLRQVTDEFTHPPRFTLGEAFGAHPTLKQYLGNGTNGLHLVFLFDMLYFKFNASFFAQKIELYQHHYPAPFMPTLVFGNHDQKRSISRIGNNPQKAKLLALYQLTARGVPVIYMGEEIGMTNGNLSLKQAKDPLARRFKGLPQWLVNLLPIAANRDVCRTPMQWNASAYAGFSTVQPWLPVNANFAEVNVATQLNHPGSLLNTYSQLLNLRKTMPALQNGTIELLPNMPKHLLAYTRKTDGQTLRVFLNFSAKPTHIACPHATPLFATHSHLTLKNNLLELPAWAGAVVQTEQ
ncbi:MAG TPA: alpha-glucosidase [Chitinophagales bacterium]|nr:alpha-glucosidase [Chitinophagales bacterium]HRK26556.1 alpha-glucosidase [Chitinophagales bacterium]